MPPAPGRIIPWLPPCTVVCIGVGGLPPTMSPFPGDPLSNVTVYGPTASALVPSNPSSRHTARAADKIRFHRFVIPLKSPSTKFPIYQKVHLFVAEKIRQNVKKHPPKFVCLFSFCRCKAGIFVVSLKQLTDTKKCTFWHSFWGVSPHFVQYASRRAPPGPPALYALFL